MADAREARRLLGSLRDVKELIEIGAYQAGSDPLVDRARALSPALDAFLRQSMDDTTSTAEAWDRLHGIVTSS